VAPTNPPAPEPSGPSVAELTANALRTAREQVAAAIARGRASLAARRADRAARPAPTRGVGARGAPTPRATGRRVLPVALLIALVAMLSAGAAYAVVSMVNGSGGPSAAVLTGPPWLGVDVLSSPFGTGVLVGDVVPGSPADQAGLVPGDVITEINNHPIQAPGDVNTALAGLHPGDHVQIQIEEGLTPFTLQATLAPPPPGTP
jgi:hypothetical protein